MSKIPCGGFELGEGLKIDENNKLCASGGGVFVVNLSFDGEARTYSIDKNFNEIETAIENKQRVLLFVEENGTIFSLTQYQKGNNVIFTHISTRKVISAQIYHEDNSIEVNFTNLNSGSPAQ